MSDTRAIGNNAKNHPGLLPEHSYTAIKDTLVLLQSYDDNAKPPFNDNAMSEWVRQGAPGDATISQNNTGHFGHMDMYFFDTSNAFLSIDEVTDTVEERKTHSLKKKLFRSGAGNCQI